METSFETLDVLKNPQGVFQILRVTQLLEEPGAIHRKADLGAGRKKLGDPIDPAAGVLLKKAVGDPVEQGEVLAVLYGNAAFDAAAERVKNAVRIGGEDEVPIKESIEVFIGEKWEILKSE